MGFTLDAKRDTGALPAGLAEVALVDVHTSAAVGDASPSWWHEKVRAGVAPAPVIQRPRFTRWRMSDVQQFWRDYPSRDAAATQRVIAKATKASAAAKAKRVASAA